MKNKNIAEIQANRLRRLAREIGYVRQAAADRLSATRRIFGRRILAVAIHTHSTHSDGTDPVSENYAAAMRAGLDFMFATDHASLRQKRNVRGLPHAGWGQEPSVGGHHLGLLCNRRLFVPRKRNFAGDFEAARKLADFVWVPHPVGWYPSQWYPDDRIRELWSIGDVFAMEIINGANKIAQAYDAFDRKAVETWDRLLCDGKRVAAMGGSDAHIAEDIATVWTGVYARRCSASAIVGALNAGACFASESTLLELYCNDQPMGSEVKIRAGAPMRARFRAADAAGIKTARLISGGRVIREFLGHNRTLMECVFAWRPARRSGYIRLETVAADDLRAFASPVYHT